VLVTTLGAPPELAGQERSVPPNDPEALATRMAELWDDPDLRGHEGDALLARANDGHRERDYLSALLSVYGEPTAE
jgi:glycosyltransferase involved in cell wall biosynthesis